MIAPKLRPWRKWRVERHIKAMPAEQRGVLVLVCVQGLSYAKAAAVLNVPVETVIDRLMHARRSLADLSDRSFTETRRAGPAPEEGSVSDLHVRFPSVRKRERTVA